MKFHALSVLFTVILTMFSSSTLSQPGGELTCATYNLNDPVSTAGNTNGYYPELQVGDLFTFSMTPGTATSASWRIVSDASGDPESTLNTGGTVSGTVQYGATASGSMGVGFYIDSIDGTATIQASCEPAGSTTTPVATPVPALGAFGIPLLAGILAVLGMLGFYRRR